MSKKAIFSWALYDWANSSFATTVIAGFYPVFLKLYWSEGTDSVISTARLGFCNTVAGLLVALAAPVLGAIADRGYWKKKFLLSFAFCASALTACLYLVPKGGWEFAIVLYIFASVGFSGSLIFYDSLLPWVAQAGRLDLVSSVGYSFGYLGGGILFAINVWMVVNPATFGFSDSAVATRVSFLLVGIWWALFSIPMAIFVKEPSSATEKKVSSVVAAAVRQLKTTFKEIRSLKTIALFLCAYWFYIDGVDTIIRMAVDYGISIGLHSADLMKALLITQFVGFPAALAFGWFGEKIGPRRAIFIGIGIYFIITIWAAFMKSRFEFYFMATIIGLIQGGVQALSRSLYAKLIPVDKSAEYFGFYNMIGKFAVIIGPLLIGLSGLLAKRFGCADQLASRLSIISVSILFAAGAVLLWRVRVNDKN